MSSAPTTRRLHAFPGRDAPPDLSDDLGRLGRMPPEALVKFWQALGPCLAEKVSKETEQLLDVFCSAYRIADDDLARGIKACRFLITEAAKLDLPAAALDQDIEVLCPDQPLIKEVLLAGYEPARAEIRKGLVTAALAGHGKLLIGADYRIDQVLGAGGGVRMRQPVAMLTLQVQEGIEVKRITVQVLPDMMGKLKAICDELIGGETADSSGGDER